MPADVNAKHFPAQPSQATAASAQSTRAVTKALQGTVLINRKQLLQKVPLSERTIFDMEKRGEFPRRFAISARHVAWDLNEIDQWIERRRKSAMQPKAPGAR